MQRINRLTRTQLLTLMRSVGLHRGMLSGDYRKYHSNVYYKTMDSLSDPVDYFHPLGAASPMDQNHPMGAMLQ